MIKSPRQKLLLEKIVPSEKTLPVGVGDALMES